MKIYPCYQRTLAKKITATGIGLHSGKKVTLTLAPAPLGTGVVFVRTDLNNSNVGGTGARYFDVIQLSGR